MVVKKYIIRKIENGLLLPLKDRYGDSVFDEFDSEEAAIKFCEDNIGEDRYEIVILTLVKYAM